jgi:glycosyltransferase involved in cell wall biosynthesis
MMKVLFLIRSLEYGGAERQLVELCKGLLEYGYQISVAVFYSGGPLEIELRNIGINVVDLHKKGRWDIIHFMFNLYKFVLLEKPDILHGYLTTSNTVSLFMKPFFPSLKIIWGVRASNMDLKKYDWASRFSYFLEARVASLADLIIANSKSGKAFAVANGFPKHKMIVIHNGIDTGKFHPDIKEGKRFRKELGFNSEHKLIGLVARIDPMKDHLTFLQAAQILIKQRDDVRFVCVGDGPEPYKKEVLKLCDKLGLNRFIVWTGSIHNTYSVYNAMDIATSSSISEGFSNVIAEAMACGIPCVVTDVGDSANIVDNTGLVVPASNPALLADAWGQMLDELDKGYFPCMSSAARKRIVEEFSLTKLFRETDKTLKKFNKYTKPQNTDL